MELSSNNFVSKTNDSSSEIRWVPWQMNANIKINRLKMIIVFPYLKKLELNFVLENNIVCRYVNTNN